MFLPGVFFPQCWPWRNHIFLSVSGHMMMLTHIGHTHKVLFLCCLCPQLYYLEVLPLLHQVTLWCCLPLSQFCLVTSEKEVMFSSLKLPLCSRPHCHQPHTPMTLSWLHSPAPTLLVSLTCCHSTSSNLQQKYTPACHPSSARLFCLIHLTQDLPVFSCWFWPSLFQTCHIYLFIKNTSIK